MSFDYSVVRDRKYYDVVKGPCKFLLKLGLRIKCEGVENIPKEGAFILASNHIHFVDPAVLLANFTYDGKLLGGFQFGSAGTDDIKTAGVSVFVDKSVVKDHVIVFDQTAGAALEAVEHVFGIG